MSIPPVVIIWPSDQLTLLEVALVFWRLGAQTVCKIKHSKEMSEVSDLDRLLGTVYRRDILLQGSSNSC
jgi:hypothetical protein